MIKTPQSHPDHPVVGHHFGGHSIAHSKTAIFFCDSYDTSCGYWMTNVSDPQDRVNISERAIGRTYHLAEDHPDHWWITQWGVRVNKPTA